jgi:hypothetical protein
MIARHAFATLILVTTTGCLVGEVPGIPCRADDECATGHFCDLTVGSCQAETGEVSAPALDVTGVVNVDGDVVTSPFIERTGTFAMALVVENTGGLPAVDVEVSFSELACLNLVIDEGSVPVGIAPGGSARISFSASPDGTCGTPMITDWFLLFSGRGARGAFNINILRAPPGAN